MSIAQVIAVIVVIVMCAYAGAVVGGVHLIDPVRWSAELSQPVASAIEMMLWLRGECVRPPGGYHESSNAAPSAFLTTKIIAAVRGLSFIDDLAAVIAASNASERRTKCFGLDRGCKRRELIGFCDSARATQEGRHEIFVEIRQARPESAREILR